MEIRGYNFEEVDIGDPPPGSLGVLVHWVAYKNGFRVSLRKFRADWVEAPGNVSWHCVVAVTQEEGRNSYRKEVAGSYCAGGPREAFDLAISNAQVAAQYRAKWLSEVAP